MNVAGVRLRDLDESVGTENDPENWGDLHRKVVESAYQVIKLKGYTSWAIGLSIANLASAILRNSNQVHAVSTMVSVSWSDSSNLHCPGIFLGAEFSFVRDRNIKCFLLYRPTVNKNFRLNYSFQGLHEIKDEVFLSVPCTLGEHGVAFVVKQKLTEQERSLLKKSATTMAEVQKGLKF